MYRFRQLGLAPIYISLFRQLLWILKLQPVLLKRLSCGAKEAPLNGSTTWLHRMRRFIPAAPSPPIPHKQ
jgi:hypothetical protein